MNPGQPATSQPRVATVYSRRVASNALLMRHEALDAAGLTLSVVGPKSAIPGRVVNESVAVRFPNGAVIVGQITHIHKTHDRYRAEVSTSQVMRDVGGLPPLVQIAEPTGDLRWVERTAPGVS